MKGRGIRRAREAFAPARGIGLHDEEGEVLRILAVGDTIRPNAASAIQALHAAGVDKVVMLSGDNQRTVDAIARQVGFDEALGDLLPDQKISRVQVL